MDQEKKQNTKFLKGGIILSIGVTITIISFILPTETKITIGGIGITCLIIGTTITLI